MRMNWRRTVTGIVLTAFMAFAGASALQGCGQANTEDVPSSGASLSLEARSPITPDNGSSTVVRANGRDTLELVATVRGLSSIVGFFIPSNWGTFQGGTLSTGDGYTYYTADRSGVARATLVSSTVAGRTEVFAKSLDMQAKLLITFDYATLTLFPKVLVLNGTDSTSAVVEARGGLTPIEWWVSRPQDIGFHIRDDTSVVVYIASITDPLTGSSGTPPEPAVLYARDAEGNESTASIYTATNNCTSASLTATPSSVAAATANPTISVTLEDFDIRDASSASVLMISANGSHQELTLLPWLVDGLFQVSVELAGDFNSGTVTFEYRDVNSSCQGETVTTTVTRS